MTQWKSLSEYTEPYDEKLMLIEEVLPSTNSNSIRLRSLNYEFQNCELSDEAFLDDSVHEILEKVSSEEETKVCPECGRKYPESEIFCFKCSVRLKDIEKTDIKSIEVAHEFAFEGSNEFRDFDEILTSENLVKINDFTFSMSDFNAILESIKKTALRNFDTAIKKNYINLNEMSILDKITLFAKSFVDIGYKSYGQELGYYTFNKIFVDDRQLDALQITTILHELTHFLIKEIFTQILCKLLDASKTSLIESITTFIFHYPKTNVLIDEYAAHNVEGRFTLFGYQDYSSFLNIQKSIDMPDEEIEMLKTVGNSLANSIIGILESFIDDELLDEIKTQFRMDILDSPNYEQLRLENCILLNSEGFLKVIHFILVDGFDQCSQNIEKLIQINDMW